MSSGTSTRWIRPQNEKQQETEPALALSAEMPCRIVCRAFFVKNIPNNIPFLVTASYKKLSAYEQTFSKTSGTRAWLSGRQLEGASALQDAPSNRMSTARGRVSGLRPRIDSLMLTVYAVSRTAGPKALAVHYSETGRTDKP